MDLEGKIKKLKEIAREVSSCQRCSLYKNTTQAVPGEGNPKAKVMFLGEGPGFWEDKQGRPFVGQAGKLLDELLQSIKLDRNEVFINNVIKHRPSNNRDPQPSEIEACRIWLDKQIEIIKPEMIVTLGRFSMAKFIPNEYISRIHGQARFVEFSGRKVIVIPVYHPAAALRSTSVMEQIKSDFQKIPLFLDQKAEVEEKEPITDNGEQLNLIK